MGRGLKWYALYTKPRTEKKVAERMEREGVEVYCPLVKELRMWSDRKKWVQRPVLPSYIFVKIGDAEYSKVRMVPGVVNFVYWLGKPAVIMEEEIQRLQNFIEVFPSASSSQKFLFEIGDEVIMEYGPLKGISGIILNKKKNKVRISLDALGLQIVADVNFDYLKISK